MKAYLFSYSDTLDRPIRVRTVVQMEWNSLMPEILQSKLLSFINPFSTFPWDADHAKTLKKTVSFNSHFINEETEDWKAVVTPDGFSASTWCRWIQDFSSHSGSSSLECLYGLFFSTQFIFSFHFFLLDLEPTCWSVINALVWEGSTGEGSQWEWKQPSCPPPSP